jgi:hypothetical protein
LKDSTWKISITYPRWQTQIPPLFGNKDGRGNKISRLIGPHSVQWNNYIKTLRTSHIRITEREDEIVWKKQPHMVYTPKMGYISLNIEVMQRDPT